MNKELSEICINVENTNDNFVGVRYNKDKIQIIFPLGYRIPDDATGKVEAIRQLFRTIKLSNDKKLDYEDSGDYALDANGLPIDSFQWIIDDYLDNGIYVDNEKIYSQDNKGKVNWKRTFRTKFLISKNSLIYLNPIIEKNSNIKNIISEIHGYCIDESTKHLWFLYSKTSKVSNVKKPNVNYYIDVINDEMIRTFDDRKKLLFYHMKRVLLSKIDSNSKKSIRDYGIKHYEYVWEYMVNELYGNKDIKKYYPDATYHIKGNIEFDASKLRPDTIFRDTDNNVYILDSKYYKAATIAKNKNKLKNILPNTDSIQKQITYGNFILLNYKEQEKIRDIYNAFIIPYNKCDNIFEVSGNIENIGDAACNWEEVSVKKGKYLKIQLILVDTKYLIDSYFSNNRDRDLLVNSIKY